MRSTLFRVAAPLMVLVTIAACGGGNEAASAGATDTTDSRDLTRAGADTAAQPQLQDVPAEKSPAPTPKASTPPAPKAQTPAPAPL